MNPVFTKNHPRVGARPGTLVIPEGSPPPRIQVMRLDGENFQETQVANVEELSKLLEVSSRTWIDVQGWGDEAVLTQIAQLLDIHPLALEDAVNSPQRPKAELYEKHLLAIARTPYEDEQGILDFPQVCAFIGSAHVITFQERYLGVLDPIRERARIPNSRIRTMGPDYLGYAIVDALIDRFYPVIEDIGKQVDDLEEVVSVNPNTADLIRIQKLRRSVVNLRRIAWAQREMVREMLNDDGAFISKDVRVFLRDTQDHTAQIADVVDSLREMAGSLMDIYLSVVGQRTNEVMKVLTIMSSIFVPLTFMAGIYGMNFQYMPELNSPMAYPALLTAMAVCAITLLLFFRSKGWIGKRRETRGSK